MTPETLAELRRLLDAASRGTWLYDGYCIRDGEGGPGLCSMSWRSSDIAVERKRSDANGSLIAALHRLAPALLAEAEAAARLREALTRIASYPEGPAVTWSFDEPCAAVIARAALEPPAAAEEG